MDEEQLPTEHANEASGAGGADSPEDVVDPAEGGAEEAGGDQDAGPSETAEQVEEDSERDQAEGDAGQAG